VRACVRACVCVCCRVGSWTVAARWGRRTTSSASGSTGRARLRRSSCRLALAVSPGLDRSPCWSPGRSPDPHPSPDQTGVWGCGASRVLVDWRRCSCRRHAADCATMTRAGRTSSTRTSVRSTPSAFSSTTAPSTRPSWKLGYTYDDSEWRNLVRSYISMPAGLRRHLMGKALKNVCYNDID